VKSYLKFAESSPDIEVAGFRLIVIHMSIGVENVEKIISKGHSLIANLERNCIKGEPLHAYRIDQFSG